MLLRKLLTISCIGILSLSNTIKPAQAQSVAQLKAEINRLKKELSVYKMRDNMMALQMVLDLYGSKYKGTYPSSMGSVYSLATKGPQKYFNELRNPINGIRWNKGNKNATGVVQIIGKNIPKSCRAGLLMYQPIKDKKGKISSFYVYGCDANGKVMEEFLSNTLMNMEGIPQGGVPAGGTY